MRVLSAEDRLEHDKVEKGDGGQPRKLWPLRPSARSRQMGDGGNGLLQTGVMQ